MTYWRQAIVVGGRLVGFEVRALNGAHFCITVAGLSQQLIDEATPLAEAAFAIALGRMARRPIYDPEHPFTSLVQ